MKRIDTETLEAKLRNKLSPFYTLSEIVFELEDNNSPELQNLIFKCAKHANTLKEEIIILISKIESRRNQESILDTSHLYGKYVQLDDRFETVHIWSKKLDEENNGLWIPKEISEERYLEEMKNTWNNLYIDYEMD